MALLIWVVGPAEARQLGALASPGPLTRAHAAAAPLARRNVRLDHSDRRGAQRLATVDLALLVLILTIGVVLGQRANLQTLTAVLFSTGTAVAFATLALTVVVRVGLFAMLVTINFSYWNALVLTTNPSSWMFPNSVGTIAMFAAIAIYGFWISLGEQKVFKDAI